MSSGEPHKHHYAPQFYLRNFASDAAKQKIWTLAKNGDHAVWAERSISTLGYEEDFYIHYENGVPVSVETDINRTVETPIAETATWAKIVEGRTADLDVTDKPVLYSLIRHLDVRTPHNWHTLNELATLAANPDGDVAFTYEEREMYAEMRTDPEGIKALFNLRASSLNWSQDGFAGCAVTVMRSRAPFRTSTTPVISLPAPPLPGSAAPLPGAVHFQNILVIEPHTAVSLVLGNFVAGFHNVVVDDGDARLLNRQFAGYFAKFESVRHLVSSRTDLVEDMTWAPYDVKADTPHKIVFQRRAERA